MTAPPITDFSNLTPEQRARHAAAKRVIFLTVFLDLLGFGVVIPLLGVYAAQFGASPWLVGILASTYSIMGFLFSPFWGRLSDRVGRRPVLLYSIFGTAIGYVFFAVAHTIPFLFLSRIVDGITGGNISVAQAYLSDITPPEERSKTFGIFGAIFGIGFSLGPAIGALITHIPGPWGGNLGIGTFTAALAFVNWILAVKLLPETLSPEIRAHNQQRSGGARVQIFNISGFQRTLNVPGLSLVIAISFFAMVAFATMQGSYSLFLITRYNRPAVQEYIKQNPERAIAEARVEMGRAAAESPTRMSATSGLSGDESGGGEAGGLNEPYSRTMGGDFDYKGYPAPPDMTWREIEKTLVRPRATAMSAWIFACIGIVACIVQGGLIGPLKKRFGQIPLVVAGTFIMAAGLALITVPKTVMGELPILALLAFGNSIASPILTALVSELSPEHERGEVIGVYQSISSLGRIIGPNVGGLFFNFFSAETPYMVGAGIMLFSFFLAMRLSKDCPQIDSGGLKASPVES